MDKLRSGSQLTKTLYKMPSTDGNKDVILNHQNKNTLLRDKISDDLESLMNMFKKRVYPLPY